MKNLLASILFTLCLLSVLRINAQTSCVVNASANTYDLLCGDTLKLTAIGNGILAFRNNFNCGSVQCPQGDPTNPNDNYGTWSNSSTAQFNNPCAPNHPSGTAHIWFNQNSPSPRVLATTGLPLATGGVIKFDMRFADPDFNGNASPCENPDAGDEGVHLQYSIDNGASWTDIPGAYYGPNGGNDPVRTVWTSYEVGIPIEACQNGARIRWAQLSNTGTPGDYLDHWGLDNLEIIVNPPTAKYCWSHTNDTLPTGNTPGFVPVVSGTYTVNYTDGTNKCTDQVNIIVRKPTVSITKNPNTPVCPGTPVQLNATSSLVMPNLVCQKSTSGCVGNTAVVDIGTGTVNSTTYNLMGPQPVGGSSCTGLNGSYTGNYAAAARTQMIILANELPTWFKKGQIYQLQINMLQAGSYSNFQISMSCTNKNSFASSAATEFQTGLTTVYSSPNEGLTAGWNLIEFQNHYDWDGTSNLIIQICYSGSSVSYGNALKTATGFNSVIHTNTCQDDAGCNMYNANTDVVDVNRPTLKLGVCYRLDPILVYSWTPNLAINDDSIKNPIVSPGSAQTYTVTVRDMNTPPECAVTGNITIPMTAIGTVDAQYDSICQSGQLNLRSTIVSPPAGTTYSWAGPGGYTANTQNATRNPAVAGWYVVTASAGGCTGKDSVQVVIDLPPNPGKGYEDNICQDNTSYNLFSGLTNSPQPGGTWTAEGTPNAGAALNSGNFNASLAPTVPGTYKFRYTVTNNNFCGPRDTVVTINVKKMPFAGGDSSFTICNSSNPVTLSARLKNGPANRPPDTGGTWSDIGMVSAGSAFNSSTSALTLANLPAGVYRFRYVVPKNDPCPADSAIITVTVQDQPEAGNNVSHEICYSSTADLASYLTGADPGGTWRKNGVFNGSLDAATGMFTPTGNIADTGTVTFTYLLPATSPCKADSAIVTLKINGYPVISNAVATCQGDKINYVVTFQITGGDKSSYSVSPAGTFSGSNPVTYTSGNIPSGQTQLFVLSDGKKCRNDSLTTVKNCSCVTLAGDMSSEKVHLCEGEVTPDTYLGGYVDDGNDTLRFYLHTSNGSTLGNVLAISSVPNFSFDPSRMTYEQEYFISAVAADDSASYPRRNDLCLSVAPGTPVVWHRNPKGSISGNRNICPGDNADITFDFTTGKNPFRVVISDGASSDTLSGINDNDIHTVSPMDTTSYSLVYIADDNGCSAVMNGPAVTINVNEAPVATIQGIDPCADPNTPGSFRVNVTGAGSAFTVIYGNSRDTSKTTLTNITPPGIVVNPSPFNPDTAITYTLLFVSDNSGSVCPGVATGSYTIYPRPTAVLSGGGTYCEGQNPTMQVDLTGIGPWDIVYTDGNSTYNHSATTRSSTIVPPTMSAGNYTYSLVSVTDQAGPACTGQVSGQASFIINGSPRVDIKVEDSNQKIDSLEVHCSGDGARNVWFIPDPLRGAGNEFNVQYQVNGGPVQTITVQRPGSSISVDHFVGNYLYTIVSVKDTSAAGCAGSGDPARIRVNKLPSANVDFSSQDQQMCQGDSVPIRVLVSGNGTIFFDLQAPGDPRTYSGSAADGQMATVWVKPQASTVYTYSISNLRDGSSPPCTSTSPSTAKVTVNPAPTASFVDDRYELCAGSSVPLRFTVGGNPPINVTFGNGVSTPISRSKGQGTHTENISGLAPATYVYKFTSISDGSSPSCPGISNDSVIVVIRPRPDIQTITLSDPDVCKGDPVTLTFTCTGNPNLKVAYSDNFGNTDTVFNVTTSGNFPVPTDTSRIFTFTFISDGSNPDGPATACTANLVDKSVSLTVFPLPTGSLSGMPEVCEGQTAPVTVTLNGKEPFEVQFSAQGNLNQTVTLSNLALGPNDYVHTPAPSDTVVFTQLQILRDGNGCKNSGTGTAQINVNAMPSPAFTANPPGGCSPLPVTFTHVPDGNYTISEMVWNFGDNSPELNDNSTRDQTHTYYDRSTYPVTLTITSDRGCKGSVTNNVTVYPDPIADFAWEPAKVTIDDANVRFYNHSVGGQNYIWQVDSLDSFNLYELLYQFPPVEEVVYNICLIAQSGFGCADTTCRDLKVTGNVLVNIPNTFTPNYDNINDVWKPDYEGLRNDFYLLTIYDRWGQVIYESTDVEAGWNGLNKQNEMCQQGVYSFRIVGKSKYEAEKIMYSGHILLTQ